MGSTGAFVSLDTERMAKIPGDILDQVVIDPKVEMEYPDRKITLPGELPGGTRRQFFFLHQNYKNLLKK
ncbi:MAG: hypothetical protein LBR47_07945 [Spirochaetaceae bacterium]|jgi:hypothetical protein|nr:hypothetical protein [Spirochaetaceae bacterium]